MSLLPGIYDYIEKKDRIKLTIPLKGVAPSKVDIFATASTLKVNYSPYIVDIILKGIIDPTRHKATVKDGNLIITLIKKDQIYWNGLISSIEDEAESKDKKKESLLAFETLQHELEEKRKDKKIDDERLAVRKQMSLEEKERSRLEELKLEEKKTAEAEIYNALERYRTTSSNKSILDKPNHFSNSTTDQITSRSIPKLLPTNTIITPPVADVISKNNNKVSSNNKSLFEESDIIPYSDESQELDDEESSITTNYTTSTTTSPSINNATHHTTTTTITADDEEGYVDREMRYIPPPRSQLHQDPNSTTGTSNKVDISFTPRFFPSPMRESKIAEEEDWIAKNRKHLKKHGVLGKKVTRGNGVDISEADAVWLKAKGDDFYRRGDLLSAANAYSAALDSEEAVDVSITTSCLANRSACYLRLSQFADCKVDCSTALVLLEASPPVPTTIRLILRRGVSCCHLGMFREALVDHQRALQVLSELQSTGSHNLQGFDADAICIDIENLKRLETADEYKKAADLLFSEQAIPEALQKYSRAIECVASHVGCWSNRAACKVVLGDLEGCVEDCSVALSLLGIHYDTDGVEVVEGVPVAQAGATTSSTSTPAKTDSNIIKAVNVQTSTSTAVNMLSAILPTEGSDRHKSWILKTLIRRGAVLVKLGRLEEALRDYGRACSLDPSNMSLKSDLNKIINLKSEKSK